MHRHDILNRSHSPCSRRSSASCHACHTAAYSDAALHGVTLPIDDPFWEQFTPPNGWNCRCSVVQVRKSKFPATPHNEAMALGEQATQRDTRHMFRFNPGKEQKTFPDYNPYTIAKCRNCDIASKLAKGIPDNQLCAGCHILQSCIATTNCYFDDVYGSRLRISYAADKIELEQNQITAQVLLSVFTDIDILIREHVLEKGVKNPEYLINGKIADRKGIESENGVAAGFNKGIKQGCSVIVLDLDMHPNKFPILRTKKLASAINNRHADFRGGIISECYVVFNKNAIKIDSTFFSEDKKESKRKIILALEKIKSDRSHP